MKPLVIGLTAGDPNGIGPEVALRAALRPQPAHRRLVLIGHREVWERAARLIGRPGLMGGGHGKSQRMAMLPAA